MPKDHGIGASEKRREDVRFLTGRGRYTDDINLRGQAYVAFPRSDAAHGRLNGVDTSAAEAKMLMAGNYESPLIYVNVKAVFTNTVPVDAYRGAGRPDATFQLERVVDKAAGEIGMDPVELRRKNSVTAFPYAAPVAGMAERSFQERKTDRTDRRERPMYAFEITRPGTISEAVAALAGGEAQALGGGQTLIPTLKQRLADPGTLVSLSGIAEMKYVRKDGDQLVVGGGTTHAQVAREAAKAYPALASLATRIGDPAVRNRGTIGGSLANNDPSACYPAGSLASGATIVATGGSGSREIAADDFFQGLFETSLEDGEIITEVRFRIPKVARYEKFIQIASRFPLVAVYVARFADGVRVAVTGASESGVFRWTDAEAALSNDFSPGAVADLTVPADGMISDLHGSSEYRAHLVTVMTRRAVAGAS